jgi:hypothetical protein
MEVVVVPAPTATVGATEVELSEVPRLEKSPPKDATALANPTPVIEPVDDLP